MNTLFRNALLSIALTSFACPLTLHAQMAPSPGGAPQSLASPAATATAMLGGKAVKINYNRPSMRGRKVMGGIVPYGEVWRTGANPATTLITETALKIGTLDLPAGTYTLFTLPVAPGKPWQLIISKETGQWGLDYKPAMDFGRTPLMSKSLAAPQEMMSISLDNVQGKTAELHIRWETTDEWIKIEAK